MMKKYLVISAENSCVLTVANYPTVAAALALGGLDYWVKSLSPYSNIDKERELYHQIAGPNYFKERICRFSKNTLTVMASDLVSDGWLASRDLLHHRRGLFYVWERYVVDAISLTNRFHSPDFLVFANEEINKCDPDQEVYTPMIRDYARTMTMPVALAYKDLKLQVDDEKFNKFKITALAERWVRLINTAQSAAEIASLSARMFQEFHQNSII